MHIKRMASTLLKCKRVKVKMPFVLCAINIPEIFFYHDVTF